MAGTSPAMTTRVHITPTPDSANASMWWRAEVVGKAAEHRPLKPTRIGRDLRNDSSDRDACGTIRRECVDAGGDCRKCDRAQAVLEGEHERGSIARGEKLLFVRRAAFPHRADRMDHVLRRQAIAAGDFRRAGGAAAEPAAFRRAVPGPGARGGSRRRPRRRRAAWLLAAFTIASTASVVMSATRTSRRAGPISAVTRGVGSMRSA